MLGSKMSLSLPLCCLLLMAIASERSFVHTAPTTLSPATLTGSPEVVPETLDANVRELESLKQSIGKTLEMMKSQSSVYSNINGHEKTHSDSRTEVNENGKLVAGIGQHIITEGGNNGEAVKGSVRTDVDIPEKDIHKSMIQSFQPKEGQLPAGGKRAYAESEDVRVRTNGQDSNALEKLGALGSQYSPLDMAEYVFWTGDEKGVTLAIEEFLQAGLMTREEAISFLEEIKYNLDTLQNHYSAQLGLNARDRTKQKTEGIAELLKSKLSMDQLRQLQLLNGQQAQPELKNTFDITKLRYQQPIVKKEDSNEAETEITKLSVTSNGLIQDQQDYDELLERLRAADFLYTEYSLEEVIYQLAKVMFTQSLTRGSSEAQHALEKFTSFLETEADQGHISRALEKKVLDVLIASLSDTLGEHPEIPTIESSAPNEDRKDALRQIMQMIPKEMESMPRPTAISLNFAKKLEERAPFFAFGNKFKSIGYSN